MTYRTDKFAVGDKVVFDPKYHMSYLNDLGDGPFDILTVYDRENEYNDPYGQSTWYSMGHTQHVAIAKHSTYEDGRERQFSGAFFRKVPIHDRPPTIVKRKSPDERIDETLASFLHLGEYRP